MQAADTQLSFKKKKKWSSLTLWRQQCFFFSFSFFHLPFGFVISFNQCNEMRQTEIKPAPINTFTSTWVQMTVCNMKGAADREKPTENYHQLCIVPLSSLCIWMFFSSPFGFHDFTSWVQAGTSVVLFSNMQLNTTVHFTSKMHLMQQKHFHTHLRINLHHNTDDICLPTRRLSITTHTTVGFEVNGLFTEVNHKCCNRF